MMSRAIGSYFLTRFSFFNPHAINEREPWTCTIGGTEYDGGGCVEKIVSHQLGISTGYGDAHLIDINVSE